MYNEIKQLVEQAVNYGKLAKIEEHNYDEIRKQLSLFDDQINKILHKYPTCGVEQRKLLDYIEKMEQEDILGHAYIDTIWQEDTEAIISKVKKGE